MIIVNPNLQKMLLEAGYTRYRMRKDKLLGQSQLQRIYHAEPTMNLSTIDTLCRLLNVQPSDIIRYEPDKE